MDISGNFLYIFGLSGGIFIGVALRQTFPSDEMRHYIYRSFSSIAIGCLLPIHIFSSIVKQKSLPDINYFIVLFWLGALCCLSILLVSWIITRYTSLSRKYYPHYPYIASTFAGGGKAVVILAAIMPLVSGILDKRLLQQGTALDALAIFDAGYWLFYTSLVYNSMGWFFKGDLDEKTIKKKYGWENIGIVIAVFLGFVSQFISPEIISMIDISTLDKARWLIAAFIVMFSAAAITLSAKFSQFRGALEGIVLIVLFRVIGLSIPFVIMISIGNWAALISLPMFLFLISPPSTWVDRMLSSKGATNKQVSEAATIILIWNLAVFVAVIFIVIGVMLYL